MFNALRYTEELEKAGFSRDQAEVSVRVLIDVMNENFATKSDIKELDLKIDSAVQKIDSKIESVTQRLDSKIDSVAQKLDSRIDSAEYRLTIKLGAMLTIVVGVMTAIIKLIQH
jgi:hypothetical protein